MANNKNIDTQINKNGVKNAMNNNVGQQGEQVGKTNQAGQKGKQQNGVKDCN